MFLYQLFYRLSRDRGWPYYSSNHIVANDGEVGPDLSSNFCLGPLRTFDTSAVAVSSRHRVKRIFQVRDPRDILVSQFYSLGWRHTDEGFDPRQQAIREAIRGMTIDQYVVDPDLAIRPLASRFRFLLTRSPGPDDRVLRYEQMVTDFPGWLRQVVPVLEFRWPSLVCLKYAMRFRNEFRPDRHPHSHKRRVTPGDYRRALHPATIERLNDVLEPVLGPLGYPR